MTDLQTTAGPVQERERKARDRPADRLPLATRPKDPCDLVRPLVEECIGRHTYFERIVQDVARGYVRLPYVDNDDMSIEEEIRHWDAVKRDLEAGYRIADDIEERYELGLDDFRPRRRSKRLNAARRELCYRLYNEAKWSTPMIGRFLARDHSSVLSAISHHSTIDGAPDTRHWHRPALGQTPLIPTR